MERSKGAVSEFAVASLVMGIVSFINLLGLEKSAVAIVFGILALRKIGKADHIRGRGLAIAGLILGLVAMAMLITLTVKYYPQLKQLMEKSMQH